VISMTGGSSRSAEPKKQVQMLKERMLSFAKG
jgi:hypothetical protein